LYTLNIGLPITGQYFGVDGLTLLLLRASSPVITTLLFPKPLAWNKKMGVVLAALGTLLAALGAQAQLHNNNNKTSWLGVTYCLGGTITACLLAVEQARLFKAKLVTQEQQFAHMHLFCFATLLPWLGIVAEWLWQAPLWITLASTLMQWLCSISIASITAKRDAISSQIALTLRRAICSVLVAIMYSETATQWHWASLVCTLVSSIIYEIF